MRGVEKNPNRIRLIKVKIKRPEWKRRGLPQIEVLRPPCYLSYYPAPHDKPDDPKPYARLLFYYWSREQWSFDTRARWLFQFSFKRNFDRSSARILLLGYVWWQRNTEPTVRLKPTPYKLHFISRKKVREAIRLSKVFT